MEDFSEIYLIAGDFSEVELQALITDDEIEMRLQLLLLLNFLDPGPNL